jgi:hypothetical protein
LFQSSTKFGRKVSHLTKNFWLIFWPIFDGWNGPDFILAALWPFASFGLSLQSPLFVSFSLLCTWCTCPAAYVRSRHAQEWKRFTKHSPKNWWLWDKQWLRKCHNDIIMTLCFVLRGREFCLRRGGSSWGGIWN